MKKKITVLSLSIIMVLGFSATANAETYGFGKGQGRTDSVGVNDYSTSSWDRFTYNYEFESGVNYKEELGKPTTTDEVPRDRERENERRNKDVSFTPPPYGFMSGSFATEASNPYVTHEPYNYIRDTTDYSIELAKYDTLQEGINSVGIENQIRMPTSTDYNTEYPTKGKVTIYNPYVETKETEALTYDEGHIGWLTIPSMKLDKKVFEGESTENMRKGIAHISYTSAWDGNVGLCGHNRGSYGYFEGIQNLRKGDKITYETRYGVREYEVSYIDTIDEDDYSDLSDTSENRLTLITCVRDTPSKRYVVVATEK